MSYACLLLGAMPPGSHTYQIDLIQSKSEVASRSDSGEYFIQDQPLEIYNPNHTAVVSYIRWKSELAGQKVTCIIDYRLVLHGTKHENLQILKGWNYWSRSSIKDL